MTTNELEIMASTLEASGSYKILRRLDPEARRVSTERSTREPSNSIGGCVNTADPNGPRNTARSDGSDCANDNQDDTLIGVVVDVESTGVDPESHRVIELALRRFRFDGQGNIKKLDHSHAWFEDPGEPLDPKIIALTGITDSDLYGQAIDDTAATALLRSADVVIAHNAAFDREFIERRLPGCAGLAWACSMVEVDWLAHGFDGRSLGWLLAQCGWFHGGAHRAGADVDAVIALLHHRFSNGKMALSELLESASTTGWTVKAVGAHFDVRASLRGRGYRWDAISKIWSREIVFSKRADEEIWLAEHVYAAGHRPRLSAPIIQESTWFTRHA